MEYYLGKCDYIQLKDNESWEERIIRCRTIGDMTCTGVAESEADNFGGNNRRSGVNQSYRKRR